MLDRLLRWGFPAALGALAYALFLSLGLPDLVVFPAIFLGAVIGSMAVTIARPAAPPPELKSKAPTRKQTATGRKALPERRGRNPGR